MAIHRWTAVFLSIINKAPHLFCLRRGPSKPLNVRGSAEETVDSNVFVIGKIAPRLEFHLCVPILSNQ